MNNLIPNCACYASNSGESQTQLEMDIRRNIENLAKEKREDDSRLTAEKFKLIKILKNKGRDVEAERICRPLLALLETSQPDSLEVAEAQDQLGRILRHQARLAEAEFYQRKALALREKLLPPDDSEIALALVDLAKVLQSNRGDEARALLTRALDIVTKNGDKKNQPNVSGNLASCLLEINQTDEAIRLYQECLNTISLDVRPDEYGAILANIGAAHFRANRYDQAASYYTRAKKVFEDHGIKTAKFAVVTKTLGDISIRQGRYGQASQQLRQAMAAQAVHQENPFTKSAELERFEFLSLLKKLRKQTTIGAKNATTKTATKSTPSSQLASNIDAEILILEKLKSNPNTDVTPSLERIYTQRVTLLGKENVLTCEVALQIAVMLKYLNGGQIHCIVNPANSAVSALANKLLLAESGHSVKLGSTIDLLGGRKEALSFITQELIWLANLNGQNKYGDLATSNLELAEKCARAQLNKEGKSFSSQQIAQKLLTISNIWSALGNLQQSARLAEEVLVTSQNLKDDKLRYLSLLQIATLDLDGSDLEPAKEHATDARKIALSAFGATEKEIIPCDRILAQVSLANGAYTEAQAYSADALRCSGVSINDKIFLHNISGFAYLSEGKYELAKAELETSLDLCNDSISNQAGDRSMFTAASTALAEVLVQLGEPKNALRELDWALSSDQGNDAFGGLLAAARDCAGLSCVQEIEGDHESASRYALQAAEYTDKFLKTRISQLSFAQQCSFVNVTRQIRSLLLDNCTDAKSLPKAYEYIMGWQGLLIETLRRQSAISAAIKSAPTTTKNMISELAKTRSKLGELAHDDETTAAEVATLTEKKERLERGLADLKGSQFFTDILKDRDTTWFRNLLKPDQAFLDILTYRSHKDKLDHYALILLKAGPGGAPHFFDLGLKKTIDKQINEWRNNITVQIPSTTRDVQRDNKRDLQLDSPKNTSSMAAEEYLKLTQSLANLFITNPEVSKLLGSEVKQIWLCPESEMARVPWNSLCTICGGSKLTISEVDSPREFVQIALNKSNQIDKNGRLLLAGVGTFNDDAFIDLPGTDKEIKGIKREADLVSFPTDVLFDAQANKTDVCDKISGASIAHFSTHGFARGDKSSTSEISKNSNVEFGLLSITSGISRNPLVDSGLVLSSSYSPGESIAKSAPEPNSRLSVQSNAPADTHFAPKLAFAPQLVQAPNLRSVDDVTFTSRSSSSSKSNTKTQRNLLTAEEIVGLNLKNCRLVSLSACKTGLGTGLDGQGVIGLRSAILAAGARSILMSLWSVDDDATQQLMCKFYSYLLDPNHPVSEVEALAKAQEYIRSQPQWKSPIYWAGWVIAGDGWQTIR